MVSSFVKEIEGVTFTFNTMNAERLQLYQVYVLDNEVKKRFHMQLNEENRFKIIDRVACPTIARLVNENPEHIELIAGRLVTAIQKLVLKKVVQRIAVISSSTSAGFEDFSIR